MCNCKTAARNEGINMNLWEGHKRVILGPEWIHGQWESHKKGMLSIVKEQTVKSSAQCFLRVKAFLNQNVIRMWVTGKTILLKAKEDLEKVHLPFVSIFPLSPTWLSGSQLWESLTEEQKQWWPAGKLLWDLKIYNKSTSKVNIFLIE